MATDQKNANTTLTTEPFPIQVLCNFIQPYKGERETLPAFLTNCSNALTLATENQKTLLLKYILSRLEGKAQIACSNKVFDTFDALKNFLQQNFGERKHYNHLLIDLQSCKQLPNETVAQYALRMESCLTALQSEIHNSETLKKDLPGRIAMTEDLALHTFCLGLHPRLSNMVRCRSVKTLNSAINVALEEEKIQNLLYKNVTKIKSCKICGRSGHSETECIHRQKRGNSVSPSFTEPKPSTSGYNTQSQSQSQESCRYCKKPGHHISQCRKRKFNNEKYKHFNSNPSSNSVHHISSEPSSDDPMSGDNNVVDCEFPENNDNLN